MGPRAWPAWRPPLFEDDEATIDQLKARLEKAIVYLKTLDPGRIDASIDHEIVFPLGPTDKGVIRGEEYFTHYVLPNFYFHASAAYAILRRGDRQTRLPWGDTYEARLITRDRLAAIPETLRKLQHPISQTRVGKRGE